MTAATERRRAKTLLAGLSLLALAGCSTSDPTPAPTQMSRTTIETAPADLQLLCADAVNRERGGGQNALPISSRRLDAGTYQVDFQTGGATTACVIDSAGNVMSVQTSTG